MLRLEAHDPQHWVNLAFAVRRAKSIAEAEPILREARLRFPGVAVIWFNLACYSAQQGRFGEVGDLLREAIRLEPDLAEAAMVDPDLAPYRAGDAGGGAAAG
jgi:Flp pilus assembly protein TadD